MHSRSTSLKSLFICGCFTLFITACTNSNPEISTLVDLSAIELKVTEFEAKNIGRLALTLEGRAPKFLESLEASSNGGKSWISLGTVTPGAFRTADCDQVCPFALTVPELGARVSTLQSMRSGDTRELLIRGLSGFGNTPPVAIHIRKLNAGYRVVSTWEAAEAARGIGFDTGHRYLFSSALREVDRRGGSAETVKGGTR